MPEELLEDANEPSDDMSNYGEGDPESLWPSVNLANAFVIPSFELARQRLADVESRLQNLIALTSTVTVAAPVVHSSIVKPADFTSVWFLLAVGIFLVVVIVGLLSKALGELHVISPKLLYEKYLHFSAWEFQKNILYEAGQSFESNRSLVNVKGRAAVVLTALFCIEMCCLIVWIMQGVS